MDMNFIIFGGAVNMLDTERVLGIPHKLVVHEGFDRDKSFRNDIALIKLKSPMFGVAVKQVTLPSPRSEPRLGNFSLIAGFGMTCPNVDMREKSVLAFTDMEIVDSKRCQLGYFRSDLQICTHGAHRGCGTCAGDSGGALVDPVTHTILGLVSYGRGDCSSSSKMTVFTKVSAYTEWIRMKMSYLLSNE